MTDDSYVVQPQEDGVADHGKPGLLDSLPARTALQGVATDVGVAIAFVVFDAVSAATVDWRLMFVTIGKTALMTVASWVMKRRRPPVVQP